MAFNILVVEDDPSVRMLMKSVLESEGHTVTEASDGREALTMILEKEPDVALVDVRMPRLDGFGLLQELQASGRKDQRVLLVTGAVDEGDYLRGWGLGADGYISKPFDPQDLIRSIEEVMALKADEREKRRQK